MAEYIAAKTEADATGADFTVDTPVGVSCYGAWGSEIVGTVMKKNSDGTYKPLTSRINPNASSVDVKVRGDQEDFVIVKPGTYMIEKHATNGVAGIDIEGA